MIEPCTTGSFQSTDGAPCLQPQSAEPRGIKFVYNPLHITVFSLHKSHHPTSPFSVAMGQDSGVSLRGLQELSMTLLLWISTLIKSVGFKPAYKEGQLFLSLSVLSIQNLPFPKTILFLHLLWRWRKKRVRQFLNTDSCPRKSKSTWKDLLEARTLQEAKTIKISVC